MSTVADNQRTVGNCSRCKRDLSDANGVPCLGCIPGSPPIPLPAAPLRVKVWRIMPTEMREEIIIEGAGMPLVMAMGPNRRKTIAHARKVCEALNFGWRK